MMESQGLTPRPSTLPVALSRVTLLALLILFSTTATACAAIGGIFKAGLWVGLIVAAVVIVLVLFLVRSISSR